MNSFLSFVDLMNEAEINREAIVMSAMHDLKLLRQLKSGKSQDAVRGLVADLEKILILNSKAASQSPPNYKVLASKDSRSYQGDPSVARLAQQDPREIR